MLHIMSTMHTGYNPIVRLVIDFIAVVFTNGIMSEYLRKSVILQKYGKRDHQQ